LFLQSIIHKPVRIPKYNRAQIWFTFQHSFLLSPRKFATCATSLVDFLGDSWWLSHC